MRGKKYQDIGSERVKKEGKWLRVFIVLRGGSRRKGGNGGNRYKEGKNSVERKRKRERNRGIEVIKPVMWELKVKREMKGF